MHDEIKRAEKLAKLLDSQFRIFGFSFGLDPILGLIPWLGDFLGFIIGFYIIGIGINMNLPFPVIAKMLCFLVADFFVGSIPVIGDIFDFFFKANTANIETLKYHANRHAQGRVMEL